jgi:rhodanese-related sulfurtransferase
MGRLGVLMMVAAAATVASAWSIRALAAPAGVTLSPEMDVNQARALLDARPDRNALVLLDVRTPGEFAAGHLPGAVPLDISGADVQARLAQLDRTPTYLVYCRTQNRSGRAAETMRRLGFGQVTVMVGGFAEWAKRGFPVETPPAPKQQ